MNEAVFIGKSAKSQSLRGSLERFARSKAPILLVGETGTGKDRAARWLHEASGCSGSFVVIDARESESMLHAQLRGYAEGAFTGARGAKAGCLERARGGTLYLDGIDNFSLHTQKVILAVLSRGAVRRLGETRARPINARIIASSQRELTPLIQKGQFRFDLYQRIAVLQLKLPTLRSRPQDLLALVKHFLGPRKISRSAFKALIRCPWKGNVRQLKQVLEVSKVMQDEETLKGSTLEPLLLDKDEWVRDSKDAYRTLKQRAFSEEQQFLQGILARHHGCTSKTARALGLSRQQLSRRLSTLKQLQS
ncbi:MAG: sigma 54-interacting transcriptional regulator, partial [Planctomycetota bacterium]|nr:sigma 54-interacting transcriptional regulator [Planctomycetota bacterium]